MQQRLIDWFNGLSARERRLVLAGGAALAALVAYQMLWQPLRESALSLRDANQRAASTLQWMVQNRAALERSPGVSQARADGQRRNLNEIINQASAAHKAPMSRFQPSGDNTAQVWLDDVPFNHVLNWLEALENRHGVKATGVVIKLLDNPGQVNVRARLQN